MNSAWLIPLFLLLLIILIDSNNKKAVMVKMIRQRKKNRGDKKHMTELAKQFIDKECIIYTFNSQLEGRVKDVKDGAILVDKKGVLEAVNLDFVTRIREYPRKKNGKKKSVVLD